MTFLESSKSETEGGMVVARARARGSECLTNTELLFGRWNILEMNSDEGCNNVNALNATGLHI